MRQVKFKYYMQHEDTGLIISKAYDLEEIESYDGIQIPYRYFTFQRSQFTGLLDENGVEIYEGDIINDTNENYSIGWHKEMCCFVGYNVTDDDYEIFSYVLRPNFIKVIGNIHENPELLKK